MILRRLVLWAALAWGLGLCAVLGVSAVWPRAAPLPQPADAILCLGGDMSLRGWEEPGPASARRARTCAELYRAGLAPVIVFTGYGHARVSAAEAMARLARAEGVPEAAILIEPDARSTIQNAAFGLALLPPDTTRILLVSDAFHLPRSWMIFRVFGAPEIGLYAARAAYTPEDQPQARSLLGWQLRESIVIWVNLARAAAYFGGGLLGIEAETRIGWFN